MIDTSFTSAVKKQTLSIFGPVPKTFSPLLFVFVFLLRTYLHPHSAFLPANCYFPFLSFVGGVLYLSLPLSLSL